MILEPSLSLCPLLCDVYMQSARYKQYLCNIYNFRAWQHPRPWFAKTSIHRACLMYFCARLSDAKHLRVSKSSPLHLLIRSTYSTRIAIALLSWYSFVCKVNAIERGAQYVCTF